MPLKVECYFETRTQDGLMKLCRAISTAGVLPDRKLVTQRPCLELGVWEGLELEVFEERFAAFAQTVRPMSVTLASMGIFPTPERRLFLTPIVTRELLALHERMQERLKEFTEQLHPAYQVGKWHPHITLGTGADLSRLVQCATVLQDLHFPITTKIVELGLRTFNATKVLR